MDAVTWIVERTVSRRFPFRIAIEQGGRMVIAVRARAAWPGPGESIFCVREDVADPAEPLTPFERVPVTALSRVGRKLAVVLDRPQRKRCEFLVISKDRRDGAGSYEQIFFRTESAIRAHRSRSRVELRAGAEALSVVVDSAERYPWSFPEAAVTRRKLPVGDYALVLADRVAAVVERKSFDNLLTDIGSVQALHQQLADLASQPMAALVIEAQYGDFLDPGRLAGRWPAHFLARVLGEIAALHPALPVVFAGNRKMANAWTVQFFQAVARRQAAPAPQLVMEALTRYEVAPRGPGVEERVRLAALGEASEPFSTADLVSRVPGVPVPTVRRVLAQLAGEGRLRRAGRGRGVRWTRV